MAHQNSITRLSAASQVDAVQFGTYSTQEKRNASAVEITTATLDHGGQPMPGGLHDPRMGSLDANTHCGTCHQYSDQCSSHMGHYECPMAISSKQNVSTMTQILQSVCLGCGRPLCLMFRNATQPLPPAVRADLVEQLSARRVHDQQQQPQQQPPPRRASGRDDTGADRPHCSDPTGRSSAVHGKLQDRLRTMSHRAQKHKICVFDANVRPLRDALHAEGAHVLSTFTEQYGTLLTFPLRVVQALWPTELARADKVALVRQFLGYCVAKRHHASADHIGTLRTRLRVTTILAHWRRLLQPRRRRRDEWRRRYVASLYEAARFQQLPANYVTIPQFELETRDGRDGYEACHTWQPYVRSFGLYIMCKYPFHWFRPAYVWNKLEACAWRAFPWSIDDTLMVFRTFHDGTQRCLGFTDPAMSSPENLCMENVLVLSRKHRPYIRTALETKRKEDAITRVYEELVQYGQKLNSFLNHVEAHQTLPVTSERARRQFGTPRLERYRLTQWWLARYPPPAGPPAHGGRDAIRTYDTDATRYMNALLQNIAFMNVALLPVDGLRFPLASSTYAATKASAEGPLPQLDLVQVDTPNDAPTASPAPATSTRRGPANEVLYPHQLRHIHATAEHGCATDVNAWTGARDAPSRSVAAPAAHTSVEMVTIPKTELKTLSNLGSATSAENVHPMDVLREVWARWEQLQLSHWTLLTEAVQSNKDIQCTRAMKERSDHTQSMMPKQHFSARLSGKEGRMRKTQGSKRVNYSVRGVITPDASSDVHTIRLPAQIAATETVPVNTCAYNLEHVRAAIRKGARVVGGAANVLIPADFDGGAPITLMDQTQAQDNDDGNNSDKLSIASDPQEEARVHAQQVQRMLHSRQTWNAYRQQLAQTEHRLYRLNGMDQATRDWLAEQVRVGWTVECHLGSSLTDEANNFFRHPVLGRYSTSAVYVIVVYDQNSIGTNATICKQYNADFDGDEMNMLILQTIAARVEARVLTCIVRTPLDQEQIVPTYGPIQDVVSGAFTLTQTGLLFTGAQYTYLLEVIRYPPKTPGKPWVVYPSCRQDSVVEHMYKDAAPSVMEMEPPAILAGPGVPEGGWYTGHQVLNALFPVDMWYHEKPQTTAAAAAVPGLEALHKYVHVYRGQLVHGQLTKGSIGNSRESILHTFAMEYGHWPNAFFVSDLQRVIMRYTRTYGTVNTTFTACIPPACVRPRLERLVERIFHTFHEISDLTEVPVHIRQTRRTQLLQQALMVASDIITHELPNDHPLYSLIVSGAKGSFINIAQMMGMLGQQSLASGRIEGHHTPGGDMRTLCIGERQVDNDPTALGFCARSYYRGLVPMEYFNHATTGCEGLVDTAVSTSKAGQLSRSAMQATSANSVQYDGSVRNMHLRPIQWTYLDGFETSAVRVTSHDVSKIPADAYLVRGLWWWRPSTDTDTDTAAFTATADALVRMLEQIRYRGLELRTQVASMPHSEASDTVLRTPVEWRTCMHRAHARADATPCPSASSSSPHILQDAEAEAWVHGLYTLAWTDWVLSMMLWLRETQAQAEHVLDTEAYAPDRTASLIESGAWSHATFLPRIRAKADDICAYWKDGYKDCATPDSTMMFRAYLVQWMFHEGFAWWHTWYAPTSTDPTPADVRARTHARAVCLHDIVRRWVLRTMQSRVAPGEAVGTQAVHSAMRPASQSTLNVFHLPGVAQQQSVVATGLDRISQLIGATDCRATSVMYVSPHRRLEADTRTSNDDEPVSKSLFQVQERLQSLHLDDVIASTDIRYSYDMADVDSFLWPRLFQEMYTRFGDDPATQWKRGTMAARDTIQPPETYVQATATAVETPRDDDDDDGDTHDDPSAWHVPATKRARVFNRPVQASVLLNSMDGDTQQEETSPSVAPRRHVRHSAMSDSTSTSLETETEPETARPAVGAECLRSPWLRSSLMSSMATPLHGTITAVQEWNGRPPSLRSPGMSPHNAYTLRQHQVYKSWEMFHFRKNTPLPYTIADLSRVPAADVNVDAGSATSPPTSYTGAHVPAYVLTMAYHLAKSSDDRSETPDSSSGATTGTGTGTGARTPATAGRRHGQARRAAAQKRARDSSSSSSSSSNTPPPPTLDRAITALNRTPLQQHELPAHVQRGTAARHPMFQALQHAQAHRNISPWYIRMQLSASALSRRGYTVYMIQDLLQLMFYAKDVLVLGGVQHQTGTPVVCLFVLSPRQMVGNWLSHEMPVPRTLSPVDLDFLCVQQLATHLLQHTKLTAPLHGMFKLARAKAEGRATRRVVRTTDDTGHATYALDTESSTLIHAYGAYKGIMETLWDIPGIDPYHTWLDNPIEMQRALGIDAASIMLERELQRVLLGVAPKIDPRHARMIARTMTTEGIVTAMNRNWLHRMVPSVITNVSFEKTVPGLYAASRAASKDPLRGNLERLYFAKLIQQGSGMVRVHEHEHPAIGHTPIYAAAQPRTTTTSFAPSPAAAADADMDMDTEPVDDPLADEPSLVTFVQTYGYLLDDLRDPVAARPAASAADTLSPNVWFHGKQLLAEAARPQPRGTVQFGCAWGVYGLPPHDYSPSAAAAAATAAAVVPADGSSKRSSRGHGKKTARAADQPHTCGYLAGERDPQQGKVVFCVPFTENAACVASYDTLSRTLQASADVRRRHHGQRLEKGWSWNVDGRPVLTWRRYGNGNGNGNDDNNDDNDNDDNDNNEEYRWACHTSRIFAPRHGQSAAVCNYLLEHTCADISQEDRSACIERCDGFVDVFETANGDIRLYVEYTPTRLMTVRAHVPSPEQFVRTYGEGDPCVAARHFYRVLDHVLGPCMTTPGATPFTATAVQCGTTTMMGGPPADRPKGRGPAPAPALERP